VLLREQGDEIHTAVTIEIGGRHVNGARARIDGVIGEVRLRRAGRPVLQNRELSGLPPSERRNGQVVPAVAVEICGLDARHTGPAVQPERTEFCIRETPKPDHGAFPVIRWKELTHIGDEQIPNTVPVNVAQRHACRVGDTCDRR
jgi:hypothetical protein